MNPNKDIIVAMEIKINYKNLSKRGQCPPWVVDPMRRRSKIYNKKDE